MSKAAQLAAYQAGLKTALIEFTDGDDAITIADAGVVTLLNTAVAKSEGGAVTTNIAQGLAKAWASVSAGTSYNDSFNMSSLTDNGTGDYTTTFANAMSNDDYAVGYSGEIGRHNGVTASAYRIGRLRDDGVSVDGGAHVTMSGDLA